MGLFFLPLGHQALIKPWRKNKFLCHISVLVFFLSPAKLWSCFLWDHYWDPEVQLTRLWGSTMTVVSAVLPQTFLSVPMLSPIFLCNNICHSIISCFFHNLPHSPTFKPHLLILEDNIWTCHIWTYMGSSRAPMFNISISFFFLISLCHYKPLAYSGAWQDISFWKVERCIPGHQGKSRAELLG